MTTTLPDFDPEPRARRVDFDGVTYEAALDHDRLHAQLQRVRDILKDHQWHTLDDVVQQTGDPQASISARIRDLRKTKFGGHVVERRRVAHKRGLHEYRMTS